MTTQDDRAEVSTQREQFDAALRRILIRENLDGTEWAIEQLREGAAAAWRVVEANPDASASENLEHKLQALTLESAANTLEKLLDKRTAELAARE